MDLILKLYNRDHSIFTIDELREIFGNINQNTFKNKLDYYIKKGIIIRITRGVFTLKEREINRFELANKIYSPSYISFFTALYHHGVIFQYEDSIYLAYKKSDTKKVLDIEIQLKNLKKSILLSPDGIINNGNYSLATAERAFLDTLYIYKDIHFDNLSNIDYDKVLKLLPIYNSKTLTNRAKSYFLK